MSRGYAKSEIKNQKVRESLEPLEPGAVSYTHLRAHETVLDLVCRLLLDKKLIESSNAIYFSIHLYAWSG